MEPGQAPGIEELILDATEPGEVRVRMAAAGVCHSDLHVDRWRVGARPPDVVLGHEGVGMGRSRRRGRHDRAEGDLVVLAWTAPCGTCRWMPAQRAVAVRDA